MDSRDIRIGRFYWVRMPDRTLKVKVVSAPHFDLDDWLCDEGGELLYCPAAGFVEPASLFHRFRFGLRGLFVLVTAMALLIFAVGLLRRRHHLEVIAAEHYSKAESASLSYADFYAPATVAWRQYHRAMAIKYERASHQPWLAVDPDPPEPPAPKRTPYRRSTIPPIPATDANP